MFNNDGLGFQYHDNYDIELVLWKYVADEPVKSLQAYESKKIMHRRTPLSQTTLYTQNQNVQKIYINF
jgi:hypothetical protein